MGLIFLNKVFFQNKGVLLTAHNNVIHITGMVHHYLLSVFKGGGLQI